MTPIRTFLMLSVMTPFAAQVNAQERLDLELRLQKAADQDPAEFTSHLRREKWLASKTAIIVCDVWDYHHCLNAVRRMEQFVPRLNEVLNEARKKGVLIIHSPSDCMDAYREHAARIRAVETPVADDLPDAIESWCSVIPAEERASYPIDQSDGGEDDDPTEHAEWAAKLQTLGRNPNMPWKKQTEMIEIDESADYISDRGDEVWNILTKHNIENVILTGVHTNMCVLGRPFGLRQLARNGKRVVLMRDMTDTMYNPKRWPYVSHFEGTRRVLAHIERFVCPTITSDQIIGGESFQFQGDSGEPEAVAHQPDPAKEWASVSIPSRDQQAATGEGSHWYRCIVTIPKTWVDDKRIRLKCRGSDSMRAWVNGQPAHGDRRKDGLVAFSVRDDQIEFDDANLLVLQDSVPLASTPVLSAGKTKLVLAGRWQTRLGDDPKFSSMPLPAKFGGSTDIVFTPQEPLWTPRIVTREGEFTRGIEGPACDSAGTLYAVNYARQGTIGRIEPDGAHQVFVDLPSGSVGNGIRIARDGSLFVADYTGHNVLRIDPSSRNISVHAHSAEMNQPNDLALAPDGKTLYASDPNWSEGTGNVWRIDEDGSVTRVAKAMGTTNGIEVSPDGTTLYVNESKQRNVWAFTITSDRTLAHKRLLRNFKDHGFDGMRCDVDGNLYITRHGKGTVVKMSPTGEVIREIPVLGTRPTNICFGGADRRTAYVTEVDATRIVSFRVDRPGRE